MTTDPHMEKARELAAAIASDVLGNDHLSHKLDEQQQDEVHGDVQGIAFHAIATALREAHQAGKREGMETCICREKANAAILSEPPHD